MPMLKTNGQRCRIHDRLSVMKILFGMALLLLAVPAPAAFTPDGRVNPDDYTVLMVVDTKLAPGLKPFQAGSHGKFFVDGWSQPAQQAVWDVTVPETDDYAVNVLLRRRSQQPLQIEVMLGEQRVRGPVAAAANEWTRQSLEGTLHLPKGPQTITLRLSSPEGNGEFKAQVMSVELVRPAVRQRLHAAAEKQRADTKWFQDAGYGFMMHWTAQSHPRTGEQKPYSQAVKDFNVEAFADQMKQGGAGFVVLTTSHALQYFPAPIRALDQILPGRTSQRDLVADLAEALNKRGIQLMLYYHLGAASDAEWMRASGFWETDTRKFFGNWQAVIGEISERYGSKLAGWWFDDGSISYYYRSAPWETLARTARAGFPQRLIGFNPWELPSPTEFQDLHLGEGFGNPAGAGRLLQPGGNGRYPSGPHQGLQACATLITEGDWGHFRKNSEIGKPHWNAEQLADLMKQFAARRNVPIFNLEIYQEGTVSPASIELFRQARLRRDAR